LQALLAALPGVYMALKVVGGLYLMWIAVQIWRGAHQPLEMGGDDKDASRRTVLQSFRQGLVTQLSNPKIVVVYSSVFAALLPAQFPFARRHAGAGRRAGDGDRLVCRGGGGAVFVCAARRLFAQQGRGGPHGRRRDGAARAAPGRHRARRLMPGQC
jgi:hypothetical protein